MSISIGGDSFFMQQKAASASTAKADKLSSSLGNIENGTATD